MVDKDLVNYTLSGVKAYPFYLVSYEQHLRKHSYPYVTPSLSLLLNTIFSRCDDVVSPSSIETAPEIGHVVVG